jgi:uncharacterized protein with HEPN domain
MSDEVKKYLADILNSCLSIEEFTKDVISFSDYERNKMLKRAVERELEIIGEALNKARKEDSSINITKSSQIIGLRNRIIHEYEAVNDETIYTIIKKYMPVLKNEAENLLKED